MNSRASREAPAERANRSVLGSVLRRLVAAGIIALGCLYIGLLGLSSFPRDNAAQRDFIEYWAAGQLLVHDQNPYDQDAVYALEKQAGMRHQGVRISLSPPVALEFAAPLGLIGPKLGLVIWLLAQLGGVGLAAALLWAALGRPDSRYHLLAFLFAPAVACQLAGQLGNFFLLALALFLYLHRTRPFLAGAMLFPFALKPHLFLPFALCLLLWVVLRGRWAMLAGWTVALGASCGASLWLDQQAWPQYVRLTQESPMIHSFVPALSVAVRFWIRPRAIWIEFVPEAAACAWAAWFFWTRRREWDWLDHGLLVLLVAEMCSPYGWFTDETVLFAAVLAGIYRAVEGRRTLVPIFVVGTVALVEVLLGRPLESYWYLWTTPAWLGWYLYATGRMGASGVTASGPRHSEGPA